MVKTDDGMGKRFKGPTGIYGCTQDTSDGDV